MVLDALDSGWVAPLGPHVEAFEREVADLAGRRAGAALSSGTAALHLALLVSGVGPGDEVIVPTLTFVASANAVVYTGARPRFVDVDPGTWQLDPELLEEELTERAAAGRPVRAVLSVDLYGRCADYSRIEPICVEHGVTLIEDAAEAIGATHAGRPAGSFGHLAVFSFNGNKLLTTSGGGMLVADDEDLAARVRNLASQAREPVGHYEHAELGFNYRMSNLLAALGRAQLADIEDRVAVRRRIRARYVEALADLPGVSFPADDPHGEPTHWLTVLRIDPEAFGADRDDVCRALAAEDIEARPAWKPMHLQPLYAEAPHRGRGVADAIWETGLCLPSGHELSAEDQDLVVGIVRSCRR
jgi:dTDP-4-amino-4,6-dideoxygalactose transaminase